LQAAANVASSQRHVGWEALAVPGTGASWGFSTVTDHGIDVPGEIGVGLLSAMAVTDFLVWPAGSVKLTLTGKGLTTTVAGELFRTVPVTDVCTTGGMLALTETDDGTVLSICWSMWSTVADTLPTGHTT
jgi:hypothetical protein